jgi:hypothetical protein
MLWQHERACMNHNALQMRERLTLYALTIRLCDTLILVPPPATNASQLSEYTVSSVQLNPVLGIRNNFRPFGEYVQ